MNDYSYIITLKGIIPADMAEDAYQKLHDKLEAVIKETVLASISIGGQEDNIEVNIDAKYENGKFHSVKTEREVW